MNTQLENISKQELEQLCRLYNECRLSVIEERELEYLLLITGHDSELISTTRQIMGLSDAIFLPKPQPVLRRRYNFIKIAASVAIIAATALTYIGITRGTLPENEYIAYADGHRVDDHEAMEQVTADMAKAEAFITRMQVMEKAEQLKVQNFINHTDVMP